MKIAVQKHHFGGQILYRRVAPPKKRRQCSVNMVKEITEFMNGINLDEMATGGTHRHDQMETNFCHSFAVVSGLRNGLSKAAGSTKSKETREKYGSVEVRGNKTVAQVLVDNSTDDGFFKNVCSFQKMLAGFINNVNPRSLEGLDGDTLRISKMANQAAYLDKDVVFLFVQNAVHDSRHGLNVFHIIFRSS